MGKGHMKICEMCGNEIAAHVTVCPFCESVQRVASPMIPRRPIETINLEAGLPSVEEGLLRLERELAAARRMGVRLVRIIHGWGSSGKGGKLRAACRAFLQRELQAKHVKAVVHGEDYSCTTIAGRNLLSRFKQLNGSERSDSRNPGITFVEL